MERKEKKMRGKRLVALILAICVAIPGSIFFPVFAANDWNYDKVVESLTGKPVGDYTDTNPNITGSKAELEEMKLEEKAWFEYVDYTHYKDELGDDGYIYRIYTPVDYGASSIMAIRDYDPDEGDITGASSAMGTLWDDMALIFANVLAANASVVVSGGISSGIAGAIGQESVAVGTAGLFQTTKDIIKNAPYYATPTFMGIRNTEWNGISNTGFYNADSITIQMDASESFSVLKTNTINSGYTVGGESSAEMEAGGFLIPKVKGTVKSLASSALDYGVDFQQSQSIDNSIAVSRTFNARTDKEVANVAWKLCEYKVVVTYRVEVISKEDGEESIISEHYLEQDLLHGVCRVFANGYIEHWNTGKLVTYADFFEGFLVEQQLIADAKAKMGGK